MILFSFSPSILFLGTSFYLKTQEIWFDRSQALWRREVLKWKEKPIDPIRFLRVWGFTPQLVAPFGNHGNVRMWAYLPEGRNFCPPPVLALCFLLHCGNSHHLTLLVLPMDVGQWPCLPGCDGLTSEAVLRPVTMPCPLWWAHLWGCTLSSLVLSVRYFSDSDEKSYQNIHNLNVRTESQKMTVPPIFPVHKIPS